MQLILRGYNFQNQNFPCVLDFLLLFSIFKSQPNVLLGKTFFFFSLKQQIRTEKPKQLKITLIANDS